jgi:ketosteroid isomerase-like protein
MPSANADIVRANSEAFSRRDIEGMLAVHAPDAVVLDRRRVGWGEFRGADALRSYYQGLFDNADELNEDLEMVADEGDVVVAACRLRARLAGAAEDEEVAFDYALRISLAGGLIASVEIYDDARAALDAASDGAPGSSR